MDFCFTVRKKKFWRNFFFDVKTFVTKILFGVPQFLSIHKIIF